MVLLKKRATNVLQSVHNGVSGGHLGINKILDKVRERFYWIKCRDDLVQLIKGWRTLQATKSPHKNTRGEIKLYYVCEPFERFAGDIARPFSKSDWGDKFVMRVIYYFCKWPKNRGKCTRWEMGQQIWSITRTTFFNHITPKKFWVFVFYFGKPWKSHGWYLLNFYNLKNILLW